MYVLATKLMIQTNLYKQEIWANAHETRESL